MFKHHTVRPSTRIQNNEAVTDFITVLPAKYLLPVLDLAQCHFELIEACYGNTIKYQAAVWT